MERGDVRDRAERHQIEQGEQVGLGAASEEAALAQHPHRGHRQQECDAHGGEMAMRGGQRALIQPVGVDQREGAGEHWRALVMIDHDHVDPGGMGHLQRLVRHRPAIDGDDQPGALPGDPHQRLARGAVAFQQAIGNVVLRLAAQRAQQPDQQRRAGRAIHVIVAIDGDRLGAEHRVGQPFGGAVHVVKSGRVGQEGAQGRVAVALDILVRHPAREQELGDDVDAEASGRIRDVHVAPAPAPGLAADRLADAEHVGGRGCCARIHARRLPAGTGQRKSRQVTFTTKRLRKIMIVCDQPIT